MVQFFTPDAFVAQESLGIQLIFLFELWTERSTGSGSSLISINEIENYIAQVTPYLESAWFEIAGRYMQLKLKYLNV